MRLPRAVVIGAGLVSAIAATAAAALGIIAVRIRSSEVSASRAIRVREDVPVCREGASAEALVVFGAAADEDGPCRELAARLDHAERLWRMGVAPVVLVSGGVAGAVDESDVMAAYLGSHGLPASAVAALRPGYNTRATLRSAAAMGLRRIVAVSSPYHAHRIAAEAARHGLDAFVSSPASTPDTLNARTHAVQSAAEVGAVIWYALPPRLAARLNTGRGTLRQVLPSVLAGHARPSSLLMALKRQRPPQ